MRQEMEKKERKSMKQRERNIETIDGKEGQWNREKAY
jgi:hypothetical protein